MSKFAQRVDIAVDALSSSPPKDVDDNDFIDASRLVYDGVREIRRAVLMNRVRNSLSFLQLVFFSFLPRFQIVCFQSNYNIKKSCELFYIYI